MRYRPLIEADIPAISRVHRRACLIAYRFINWSYSERAVQDWYAGKFREWDWGLIAEDEGVVGFIASSGTHIDQLFVDPDRQATGIGTALLRMALVRMPPSVTLHVFEANTPARRFYERHGFRRIGRVANVRDGAVELVYCRDASWQDT